jgi:hypothetical protein
LILYVDGLQVSAEHYEEINKVLMKEIYVDKVELDELWTYVQEKQYFSLKEDEWLQYHLTLQMVTHNLTYHILLKKLNFNRKR